jgi:adenine-specific DNA-methyltransferase
MAKKDYSKLNKEELLEVIKNLESKKKYGLVWDEEKVPEKVVVDCQHQLPVLKEVKDKEIITDPNQPTHILIEGDNYHALSVLNYTHKGKIDLIYIDPPYNTGNKDFVYNDCYVEKEDTWRHSKWLNFMSKRLELAKELLTEKGVIFISIDDNEVAQLKLLCDKVFGEENFVAQIVREAIKGGSKSRHIREQHDYVIIYAKNISLISFSGYEQDGVLLDSVDDRGEYKKGRELNKWGAGSRREDSPSMWYSIPGPNDTQVYPIRNDGSEGRWRLGKKTMFKRIADDDVIFEQRENGTYIAYEKIRDSSNKIRQFTTLFKDNYINAKGGEALKKIFRTSMSVFDYAKPVELVFDLLIMSNLSPNSIILDFMAGSGTTGQAVLELNKKDGGNRQFILCTNNDLNGSGSKLRETDPNGDKEQFGICQRVTLPRISKVIKGYKNLKEEQIEGLGGNLKYFKTSFVKNRPNKDQLKIEITKQCTEMLCLKEGIFNLKTATKDYKIFEQNDRFMAVFYDFANASLDDLKKQMNALKGEKILYCFTLLEKLETINFKGWNDIRLEPIPQKILELYLEIFKK